MDYEDELRRCMIVPLRLLGQGAYGSVYYAFKQETGFFAAKLIQKSKFDQMELDAAVELGDLSKCPFILKYYSRAIGMRCIIFPMEYANLGTLNIFIKNKIQLPSSTLRALIKQILQGMRIFHEAQLIHRDIKCENILLHSPPGTGRVYVKITDLGFAKKEDLTKEENSIAGTAPYLAPELFKQSFILSRKVDIYAIGVTIYRILTHRYPVNYSDQNDLHRKMNTLKSIKRPSEIKDNLLWDLLSKLLEFNPEKRITAAEALQHPYFTSPESIADISKEQKDLASLAAFSELEGDSSITEYDKDPKFIVSESVIQQFMEVEIDTNSQQEQQDEVYEIENEINQMKQDEEYVQPIKHLYDSQSNIKENDNEIVDDEDLQLALKLSLDENNPQNSKNDFEYENQQQIIKQQKNNLKNNEINNILHKKQQFDDMNEEEQIELALKLSRDDFKQQNNNIEKEKEKEQYIDDEEKMQYALQLQYQDESYKNYLIRDNNQIQSSLYSTLQEIGIEQQQQIQREDLLLSLIDQNSSQSQQKQIYSSDQFTINSNLNSNSQSLQLNSQQNQFKIIQNQSDLESPYQQTSSQQTILFADQSQVISQQSLSKEIYSSESNSSQIIQDQQSQVFRPQLKSLILQSPQSNELEKQQDKTEDESELQFQSIHFSRQTYSIHSHSIHEERKIIKEKYQYNPTKQQIQDEKDLQEMNMTLKEINEQFNLFPKFSFLHFDIICMNLIKQFDSFLQQYMKQDNFITKEKYKELDYLNFNQLQINKYENFYSLNFNYLGGKTELQFSSLQITIINKLLDILNKLPLNRIYPHYFDPISCLFQFGKIGKDNQQLIEKIISTSQKLLKSGIFGTIYRSLYSYNIIFEIEFYGDIIQSNKFAKPISIQQNKLIKFVDSNSDGAIQIGMTLANRQLPPEFGQEVAKHFVEIFKHRDDMLINRVLMSISELIQCKNNHQILINEGIIKEICMILINKKNIQKENYDMARNIMKNLIEDGTTQKRLRIQTEMEKYGILYYKVYNLMEFINIDKTLIKKINDIKMNDVEKLSTLNGIKHLKDTFQRMKQKNVKERNEIIVKEQILNEIKNILHQINQKEINQYNLQLINLSCATLYVLLDDNIEAIAIINEQEIIDEIISIMRKLSVQQISRNILFPFQAIIELAPECIKILIQKGILPIIEKFLYNDDEDNLFIYLLILFMIVQYYFKEEKNKLNQFRIQFEKNRTLRRLVEILQNNHLIIDSINATSAQVIGFLYCQTPLPIEFGPTIINSIKQQIINIYYKHSDSDEIILFNYIYSLTMFAQSPQNHKLIITDDFLKIQNKILINESKNNSSKLLYLIPEILYQLIKFGDNSTKQEVIREIQIDTIVQLSNSSDKQVAEVANILLEQMNIIRNENQFLIIQSIKEIKLNLKTNEKDNNIDITEQDDEMNTAIQLSLQKNEEQKQMNNNYQIQQYKQQEDMIVKDNINQEGNNEHNNKKLFEQQLFEQKFNKQQIENIIENNYAQQINLELLIELNNQIINGKSGIEQQLLCVINRIAEYGATITEFDQENMFFYLFNKSFLSIKITQQISLQIKENNIIKISENCSEQFIQLIQTFLFINKNKNIGYINCEICFKVIKYQIDNLVNKLKQYKDQNKQDFEFEIDMKEGIRTLRSLYCILQQQNNCEYFSGKLNIHKIISPLLHINCSNNISCNQKLSLPNTEIIQQLQGIAFEILGLLALNNNQVKQYLLINHFAFEHASQIIILRAVRLQIQNDYSFKQSSSISSSSSTSYHIPSYSVISGTFHLLHSLLDKNRILSKQATEMPRLIDSLKTITIYMRNIQKELKMKENSSLIKYQNNNFIKWINQYGNEQQQRRMILEGKCIQILIELFGIGGGRISSNNSIGNALSDIQYIIHQMNNQSIQNQNQINLKSKINEDLEEEGSLEEIETHLFHTRNANDQILQIAFQIKQDLINGDNDLSNEY